MLFLGTETALVVRKNLGRTEMVMPRSPLLSAFIHCLRTAFSVSPDLGSLGPSDDSTRWTMGHVEPILPAAWSAGEHEAGYFDRLAQQLEVQTLGKTTATQ